MSITNELVNRVEKIKNVLDERIAAIYARDLPGVMNKYAPDVVCFDIPGPLQNKGIEIIKKRLQDWFAFYQGAINQEMNNLVINAGEELAFSYCLTRTFGTGIKEEKFDMWYRVTTGFRKYGDRWLIIHEHISDPINLETGKGMFELKPEP